MSIEEHTQAIEYATFIGSKRGMQEKQSKGKGVSLLPEKTEKQKKFKAWKKAHDNLCIEYNNMRSCPHYQGYEKLKALKAEEAQKRRELEQENQA